MTQNKAGGPGRPWSTKRPRRAVLYGILIGAMCFTAFAAFRVFDRSAGATAASVAENLPEPSAVVDERPRYLAAGADMVAEREREVLESDTASSPAGGLGSSLLGDAPVVFPDVGAEGRPYAEVGSGEPGGASGPGEELQTSGGEPDLRLEAYRKALAGGPLQETEAARALRERRARRHAPVDPGRVGPARPGPNGSASDSAAAAAANDYIRMMTDLAGGQGPGDTPAAPAAVADPVDPAAPKPYAPQATEPYAPRPIRPPARGTDSSFDSRLVPSVRLASTVQLQDEKRLLRRGTIIQITLRTEVQSNNLSEISGVVSRNVYDWEQRDLVIPAGAVLIGSNPEQVLIGQDRLGVVWTTLQMPDGVSYDLPGFPATDPMGATGVPGKVNNHYGRVFGNAALLSVIGAGLAQAQPQPSYDRLRTTPGQQVAMQLSQQFQQIANEMLERGIDIRPTITIPAATVIHVVLNRDLLLPPWRDLRSSPAPTL